MWSGVVRALLRFMEYFDDSNEVENEYGDSEMNHCLIMDSRSVCVLARVLGKVAQRSSIYRV